MVLSTRVPSFRRLSACLKSIGCGEVSELIPSFLGFCWLEIS